MAKASQYFKDKTGVNVTESETELGFPSEFPYEFDSFTLGHLISPLESVVCSTKTESSDQEDFFAGLTRRLSQASLHETRLSQLTVPFHNSNKTEFQKIRVLSGSPEPTLIRTGDMSGRSPYPIAFSNDAWDTIHADAEKVARSKINSDVSNLDYHNRIHYGFPPHVAVENRAPEIFNNNNLNQTSNMSYVQLKQEHINTSIQMLKCQCGGVRGVETEPYFSSYQQQREVQNKGREFGYESVKCTHPFHKTTWHHPLELKHKNQQLQPNIGSGSGPVLNGGSRGRRVCAGTGVFLPRSYMAPPEPLKKSNELLAMRNAILMQQKLCLRREDAASYEIRLPQEWTY